MERQKPRWGVYEIGGAVAAVDMVRVSDDEIQLPLINKEYKLLGFFPLGDNYELWPMCSKDGKGWFICISAVNKNGEVINLITASLEEEQKDYYKRFINSPEDKDMLRVFMTEITGGQNNDDITGSDRKSSGN